MIDSANPTLVYPNGYKPGCLPRRSKPGEVCPMAADRIKIVPSSEWAARAAELNDSLRKKVPAIYNQASVGSCAAESSTANLQVTRSVQGLPFVLFNPYSLYHFSSHGRDQGSSIDENLQLLRDQGVCSEAMWPRSKGWRAAPSAEAMEDAKNYRIEEFYEISDVNQFVSALLTGFAVTFGSQSHAVLAVQYRPGYPLIQNSWNGWGEDNSGFGRWCSWNAIEWSYGCWACRVAT